MPSPWPTSTVRLLVPHPGLGGPTALSSGNTPDVRHLVASVVPRVGLVGSSGSGTDPGLLPFVQWAAQLYQGGRHRPGDGGGQAGGASWRSILLETRPKLVVLLVGDVPGGTNSASGVPWHCSERAAPTSSTRHEGALRSGLRQDVHGVLHGALRPALEPSFCGKPPRQPAGEGSVASAD